MSGGCQSATLQLSAGRPLASGRPARLQQCSAALVLLRNHSEPLGRQIASQVSGRLASLMCLCGSCIIIITAAASIIVVARQTFSSQTSTLAHFQPATRKLRQTGAPTDR